MKIAYYSSVLALAVLCSCGGDKKAEAPATPPVSVIDSVQTPVNEETDFKFQMTIANIPSPFETVSQLAKAGTVFKKELLNNPSNESKYLTSTKKALNYGVYGVDLAYLATNNEFSDVNKYFTTTRNLAISLDAVESFDNITKSRMGGKLENKDTITRIVDEAFAATDKYLRSGERQLAASQILTGSWVESQFITLSSMKGMKKDEKNGFLFDKVYEQKLHLSNLVSLLKDFEKNADFKPVIDKLNGLNEEFKKISTVADITDAKIDELTSKIGAIRELIIK